MKTGKLIVCVAAGVAIGAVLGILFAPDKGSETRKKISGKGEDYTDEVKDKFIDLFDTINENYQVIKKEAEDLVAKGKVKQDEVKRELTNGSI